MLCTQRLSHKFLGHFIRPGTEALVPDTPMRYYKKKTTKFCMMIKLNEMKIFTPPHIWLKICDMRNLFAVGS